MVIRITPKKILSAIIVVILILSSGHALQSIWDPIRQLPLLTAAVFCGLLPRLFLEQKWSLSVCSLMILVFMVIVSMGAHLRSGTMSYIRMLCMILTAFGITMLFSFRQMVNFYLKLMTVVSICALVGHILANYTGALAILPRMSNFNGTTYCVGLIFNYIVTLPERNCGMFWEPGLFATALVYALLFELLFKEDAPKPFRVILFSACIFSANSTAGYVLWILCMLLPLMKNSSLKGKKAILKILYPLLLVVVIVTVLNLDTIIVSTSLRYNPYIQKLLSSNMSQSSRVFAVIHNLALFSEHPILGAGIVEAANNAKRFADTSTTTYLMCEYGILGLSYTIFWLTGIFRQKGVNVFCKILLVAIILFIINKEPHSSIMFSWCLLFYFLQNKNEQAPCENQVKACES